MLIKDSHGEPTVFNPEIKLILKLKLLTPKMFVTFFCFSNEYVPVPYNVRMEPILGAESASFIVVIPCIGLASLTRAISIVVGSRFISKSSVHLNYHLIVQLSLQ